MNELDKIELRSEKIRSIIGKKPHHVIRYGMIVMSIVLMGLFFAAYYIPYPENLKAGAIALGSDKARVLIPYSYLNVINVGTSVEVEFEGFQANQYGYKHGTVISISDDVVVIDDINYFVAVITVSEENYTVKEDMKGTASILISDKTVLQHLFGGDR